MNVFFSKHSDYVWLTRDSPSTAAKSATRKELSAALASPAAGSEDGVDNM